MFLLVVNICVACKKKRERRRKKVNRNSCLPFLFLKKGKKVLGTGFMSIATFFFGYMEKNFLFLFFSVIP